MPKHKWYTDSMQPLIDKAQKLREAQASDATRTTDLTHQVMAVDKVQAAVLLAAQKIIQAMAAHEPQVTVKNQPTIPTSVSTPDVAQVVSAINKLNLTTATKNTDLKPITDALRELQKDVRSVAKDIKLPEPQESVEISNLSDIKTVLEEIAKSITKPPQVKVDAPQITVDAPDLSPLEDYLTSIREAVDNIKIPEPKPVDFSKVEDGLKKVQDTIAGIRFPVPNVITDPLVAYKVADADDAGTIKYFGQIANDGKWIILKEDDGVSPKTFRYAAGSGAYPTNWTGRAGLIYDYLYQAING